VTTTPTAPTLADVDLSNLDTFVDHVPHEQFELLRREAPVFLHPGSELFPPYWCITKHSDIKLISGDWAEYSSERAGITLYEPTPEQIEQNRQMMLTMDPPRHTKLRLLVNKGFTPRMIGRLDQHIRDIAREIVDQVAERGECDFVVDVAAELPLQVIAEMMGVPDGDRHQLFDWSNRMIGSEDPEYKVTDAEAMQAATEMFVYANDLAAKKRAEPGDDIISALLQAEVDGERLTDLEFDLFFELLAVAGNETTRNLISHGMHFMFQYPDQWQKLLADRSLINTAVDEMLRFASPVMYMRRTAQRDLDLRGQHIKEGDPVALWYISGNRDEEVFDRPDEFDVSRSPNDYVVFGGGGPHFCLGANLAKLEIRVMFEEVLNRLPDIALAGDVQRLRSNFINGIKHMPVTFSAAG
jgi:cholest-4-en-3-one 26-monooxygenase